MKQVWPKQIPLELKLKDMLESQVDEKYYLTNKMMKYISSTHKNVKDGSGQYKVNPKSLRINKEITSTITTREGNTRADSSTYVSKNIETESNISDIQLTVDNTLFIKENTKKGFAEAQEGDGVYINRPHQKRGVVQKDKIQTIKTQPDFGVVVRLNGKTDGMVGTLENSKWIRDKANRVYDGVHPTLQTAQPEETILNELRIRKITPREALRLMGLDDKRIDLIQQSELISHNKQYFIAGNSIVVPVLEAIFKGIDFPKDRPLKVFETFAGYGSQAVALENLDYEVDSHTSEWFIDAIIAYALIHKSSEFWRKLYQIQHSNLGMNDKEAKENLLKRLSNWTLSTDSKKPNDLKRLSRERLQVVLAANLVNNNKGSILDIKGKDLDQYDLLTYSFPCQDLSIAGKQKGMSKGNNTRSGLLWEIERILLELKKENKLPKVLLMENVPQIHSKVNMADFEQWQKALMDLGYKNTWKDLNAKHYGVPQNRNTLMLSIMVFLKIGTEHLWFQCLMVKLKMRKVFSYHWTYSNVK